MKYLFTAAFFLFSVVGMQAQTNLDSLYAVWQDSTLDDSSRAAAYKDFIWKGHLRTNFDTAYILAKDLIDFSVLYNYPLGKGEGIDIQGIALMYKCEYEKALGYFMRRYR